MRALLLTCMLAVSTNAVAACLESTAAVDGMETAVLVMSGPDGREVTLPARVADDFRERAAGFQELCPSVVARTAIYFVFARPRRPSFHMRNVKTALDIAFIDDRGRIVDIQQMKPYVLGANDRPTYSPPVPASAALETRAGWFAEQGIGENGWTVALEPQ